MTVPTENTQELIDLTDGEAGEKVAFRYKADPAIAKKDMRNAKYTLLAVAISGGLVTIAGIWGAATKRIGKAGRILSGIGAVIGAITTAVSGAILAAPNSKNIKTKIDDFASGKEIVVMTKAEFEKEMKSAGPEQRAKFEIIDLQKHPEVLEELEKKPVGAESSFQDRLRKEANKDHAVDGSEQVASASYFQR